MLFTKILFLVVLFSSQFAQAANLTFDGIADHGTYYSNEKPCALRVSKISSSRSLVIEFTENPVYWFPGHDFYVDVGKWQEANLCPLRHRKIQFYCAKDLDMCQESGFSFEESDTKRVIQLDDKGDLVEANFGADYEKSITSELKLYTNTQVSQVACIEKNHAQAALAVLNDFTQNVLDAPSGCSRTISDADTGISTKFYSAECVERHLLPIYVNNLDGFFVEKDIATLANPYSSESGARCTTPMAVGDHFSRLAGEKCTHEALDLARAGLTQMIQESSPYCQQ